jgi:hypothetical protein
VTAGDNNNNATTSTCSSSGGQSQGGVSAIFTTGGVTGQTVVTLTPEAIRSAKRQRHALHVAQRKRREARKARLARLASISVTTHNDTHHLDNNNEDTNDNYNNGDYSLSSDSHCSDHSDNGDSIGYKKRRIHNSGAPTKVVTSELASYTSTSNQSSLSQSLTSLRLENGGKVKPRAIVHHIDSGCNDNDNDNDDNSYDDKHDTNGCNITPSASLSSLQHDNTATATGPSSTDVTGSATTTPTVTGVVPSGALLAPPFLSPSSKYVPPNISINVDALVAPLEIAASSTLTCLDTHIHM